jgi:hypothetical protein
MLNVIRLGLIQQFSNMRIYVLLALFALATTFCNAQTELPASVEKGRIMTAGIGIGLYYRLGDIRR